MADQLLYVALSASQARKRLRERGLGVKRVETAGNNRAVVVHTAAGNNLRKLEQLFADVQIAASEDALGQPLENLRNIGPTSAGWLREAGIHTIGELARIGPAAAYRLVKKTQSAATLNLLWALAAGLADKNVDELSPDERERLRLDASVRDRSPRIGR